MPTDADTAPLPAIRYSSRGLMAGRPLIVGLTVALTLADADDCDPFPPPSAPPSAGPMMLASAASSMPNGMG